MPIQIVVAGALIVDGALLVAQRRKPPELAGLWELPGGKVKLGETEPDALVRELAEELGVDVEVGGRLGGDVELSPSITLRAYRVRLANGTPRPHEHQALRWVTATGLAAIDWVPADRDWLGDLVSALKPR